MTTSVSTRSPGTHNPTRQQLDELDALLQRMLELPVNKIENAEQSEEEAADEPPPPAPPITSSIPRAKEMRPATPPISYMVVETATPRPLPPASGFEPRPSVLTPRLMPVTPTPPAVEEEPKASAPVAPSTPLATVETPVPAEAAPQTPQGEEELWVPLRSTWQPSPQTWPPLADSWHQANGAAPPIALPSPQLDLAPPREIKNSTPVSGASAFPSSPIPIPSGDRVERDTRAAVEPQLSLSVEDAPVPVPFPLLPLLWFNQGFDACLAPLGVVGRCLCGRRGRQALGLIGLLCLAGALAIAVSAGMGWTW